MAGSENTGKVEWDDIKIGEPEQNQSIVGTMHKASKTGMVDYLFKNGVKFHEASHNHPGGKSESQADMLEATYVVASFLSGYEKLNPDATTYAKYIYLWDGTKLRAVDSDGNGLCYLGSLVYPQESNVINSGEFDPNLRNHSILSPYSYSLESAGFEGGRIVEV